MTPRLKALLVSIALSLASPLEAQRMCATVASPRIADTGKKLVVKHAPTPTSPNAVCLHKDTVQAPAPVDTAVIVAPTPVPTGWTLITDRGPTLTHPGWGIAGPGVAVQNDPTGQPALAMLFPVGYVGGSSPATVYYNPAFSYSAIRWESTLSYPVGYVKHPSSVDKSVFVGVDGQNKMYTMMYDPTRLIPAVGVQGIVAAAGQTTTAWNLTPNLGANAELLRGQRRVLSCEATGNTAGQRDGTVTCWLDTTRILRYTDVQFSPGAAKFTHIHWAPIWGGGGSTLLVPQSVYLGRLRVYGR